MDHVITITFNGIPFTYHVHITGDSKITIQVNREVNKTKIQMTQDSLWGICQNVYQTHKTTTRNSMVRVFKGAIQTMDALRGVNRGKATKITNPVRQTQNDMRAFIRRTRRPDVQTDNSVIHTTADYRITRPDVLSAVTTEVESRMRQFYQFVLTNAKYNFIADSTDHTEFAVDFTVYTFFRLIQLVCNNDDRCNAMSVFRLLNIREMLNNIFPSTRVVVKQQQSRTISSRRSS